MMGAERAMWVDVCGIEAIPVRNDRDALAEIMSTRTV